jgi:hypothetical protein
MAIKHTYRHANGYTKTSDLTPRKAIREKCLDCCCWSQHLVRRCEITDCSLWPFRLGTRHRPESVPEPETVCYDYTSDKVYH